LINTGRASPLPRQLMAALTSRYRNVGQPPLGTSSCGKSGQRYPAIGHICLRQAFTINRERMAPAGQRLKRKEAAATTRMPLEA
jgi:hypothetical protein